MFKTKRNIEKWESFVEAWSFDQNSKAPKFPLWSCFENEEGEINNFSFLHHKGAILSESHLLSEEIFDDTERYVDCKGDIYKLVFDSEIGYQIPELTGQKITSKLIKKIQEDTYMKESSLFMAELKK